MYLTGVGGFSNASQGGLGSYYVGPANAMLGNAAQPFAASVMFLADCSAATAADGRTLFDCSVGAGPITAGWKMFTQFTSGAFQINASLVGNAAIVTASGGVDLGDGMIARPLFVATMTYDPAAGASNDGQVRLVLNATQFTSEDFAEGNAFTPAAGGTQPAVGAQNDSAAQSAPNAYILGFGFLNNSLLTLEQVYRHQLACLEAGDFVDGAQGGAFGAGVPTFTNLYSARRSNAAFGTRTLITGSKNALTVGQVPQAAATWPDLNGNPVRNFTRVDDGTNANLFTTAFKRVG